MAHVDLVRHPLGVHEAVTLNGDNAVNGILKHIVLANNGRYYIVLQEFGSARNHNGNVVDILQPNEELIFHVRSLKGRLQHIDRAPFRDRRDPQNGGNFEQSVGWIFCHLQRYPNTTALVEVARVNTAFVRSVKMLRLYQRLEPQIKDRLDTLEDQNATQQGQITSLQSQITSLQAQITSLQNKLASSTAQNQSLTESNNSLSAELIARENAVTRLTNEKEELHQHYQMLLRDQKGESDAKTDNIKAESEEYVMDITEEDDEVYNVHKI